MPITIPMPLAEVIDRYTIAMLKSSRLPVPSQREEAARQVEHYRDGIDFNNPTLVGYLQDLLEINGMLWDTEGEIFRGETDDMPLDEVGRRALRVRNLNRKRCAIKNRIVEHTGTGFHDEKADYADGATS